jgi:hypothetical protein
MESDLADKVRGELARYEHPLFGFDARPAADGIEVEIHLKPAGVDVRRYVFLMRQREIDHPQFPWTFQRQLYDCLHDYVIEMFTRNPQCKDA